MKAKTLIVILSILLSIAAIWFLILPLYGGVKDKNNQVQAKEKEVQDLEKSVAKINELMQSYKANEDKINLLLQMSPKDKDVAGLLNQLESLSSQSGVILYSVNFAETASPKSAPQPSAPAGQEAGAQVSAVANLTLANPQPSLKTLTASLKISGSYEAFKNFLSELEKNARLADVQSISFAGKSDKSETSNLYDFNLSCKFYYQ